MYASLLLIRLKLIQTFCRQYVHKRRTRQETSIDALFIDVDVFVRRCVASDFSVRRDERSIYDQ